MAQLTASTTVKLKHWSNGEKVHTMLEKNMLLDRYDTTMRFPSYGPHPLPTPLPSEPLAGLTQLDG